MTPFLTRAVRIEWGQCDPAGIVYAPRFLEICGESTIRLLEAAGLPRKREMLRQMQVAGFPMVDVSARFLATCTYGDDVTVETAAPVFGNSSFTIDHRIMLGARVCVECTEKRVWTVPDATRPAGLRAERVPDAVRELFVRQGEKP